MSKERFRAHIVGPGGHLDPLGQTAIIVLYEQDPFSDSRRYLASDGTWKDWKPGEGLASDAGIPVPPGFIEPLAVAIQEHQGHTSHADTEARVLREWLAVERERVDNVLEGNGQP